MSRSGRGDNRQTKSTDYRDAMKAFQEKLDAQVKANADAAAAAAQASAASTNTSTEQVQSTSAATAASAAATASSSAAPQTLDMSSQSRSGGGDDSSGRRGRDSDDRGRGDGGDENRTSQGGTAGDDALVAGRREDKLGGGDGNDTLIDAGGVKGAKEDSFRGGNGNDTIYSHWGSDRVKAGAGDDVIVSRSDAGEPEPARGGVRQTNDEFRSRSTNDKLTGGTGKDAFQFRIDLNAIPSIIAQNLLAHNADEHGGPGVVDWEGVTGENGDGGNPSHLHWLDGFGTDTITDFNRAEGDTIEVYGHTATDISIEVKNGDSYVTVRSDQGGNGGTHNGDILGVIIVKGVADVTAADITVHAEGHLGAFESITDMAPAKRGDDDGDDAAEGSLAGTTTDGNDVLVASKGSDSLNGAGGNDVLIDAGGTKMKAKADSFSGGAGDDAIYLHRGADKADGGDGADLIVSRSDGGEPVSALGNLTYYQGQPLDGKYSNDTLTGGGGNDTFQFRFDLNARPDILAANIETHAEDNNHGGPGVIDWEGVTGANGNNTGEHLHWVETIGTDTITDFVSGTDKIELYGHTVNVDDADITTIDTNNDGTADSTQIRITSEQGDGGGSHDEDQLGLIILQGVTNFNRTTDLVIHAEVHLGAFGSIDDIIVA
jgi:Ca2+-binding RTX toxin-like protein